jgi:uncharacterized integral membrane protein
VIILFVSGLVAAAVMYQLGVYITLVAVVTTVIKVVATVVGLAAILLLYRHRRRSQRRVQVIGR